MAPEWDFAEQYGVADNYYAPQISESSPNPLYYLAGYSPVFNDYGPPPYVPISQSIFGELSAYNVSCGRIAQQIQRSTQVCRKAGIPGIPVIWVYSEKVVEAVIFQENVDDMLYGCHGSRWLQLFPDISNDSADSIW